MNTDRFTEAYRTAVTTKTDEAYAKLNTAKPTETIVDAQDVAHPLQVANLQPKHLAQTKSVYAKLLPTACLVSFILSPC